jgi:hypothetical protein
VSATKPKLGPPTRRSAVVTDEEWADLSDQQKLIWLRMRTRLVGDTVEIVLEERLRLLETRVAELEARLVGRETLLTDADETRG